MCFSWAYKSVSLFSRSVMSDSLQPHESQHARPPCPSPTPGVHPNSYAILNNFWGIPTNDFNLSHDESTDIKSLLGRCKESQVATSHREQGLTFSPTFILRWEPLRDRTPASSQREGDSWVYIVPMLFFYIQSFSQVAHWTGFSSYIFTPYKAEKESRNKKSQH